MALETYGDALTFVQDKLDLRDDSMIDGDELQTYFKEAIRYCESEIHKLNAEDCYFEASAAVALVSGKSDYSLPSGIYGNKIRRVQYISGADIYEIERLTKASRYNDAELLRQYSSGSTQAYGYMLMNLDPRLGTKMRMFPTPAESSTVVTTTGNTTEGSATVSSMASTSGIQAGYYVSGTGIIEGTRVQSVDSSTQITLAENAQVTGTAASLTFTEPRMVVWYIRNATIPSETDDYIDFPEFWHFITQHVVVNCLKKELGNPRLQIEVATLLKLEQQMHDTLSNMVPDQQDYVEQDLSFYREGNY